MDICQAIFKETYNLDVQKKVIKARGDIVCEIILVLHCHNETQLNMALLYRTISIRPDRS